MKKLQELLTKFDSATLDKLQNQCSEIAETLFCDYCIYCNNEKEFYFAEVEFYYWQNGKMDEKWNRLTYPRNCKAADLFFHLSGIDICFNSNYDLEKAEGKFGGILIRAIKDKFGNITAGPLNCMLKILNECGNGNMPIIQPSQQSGINEKDIKATYRSLGKEDQEEEKEMAVRPQNPLKLCFYDSSIPSDKWGKRPRITLCKKTGKLKRSERSEYKLDRFELQK